MVDGRLWDVVNVRVSTMRLRKKAAIDLSVNFLVMLVVSLVLFGMSLYFINQFRNVGAGYEQDLDRYAIDQLRQLSRGSSFALFPESVEMRVGESESVGVGVTNTGDSELTGKLHVDFASAYDAKGDPLSTLTNVVDVAVANSWAVTLGSETTLKTGAFSSFLVLAAPKNPSWANSAGSYTFDVCFLRTDILPAEGRVPEVNCGSISSGKSCLTVTTTNSKCLYPSNTIKGLTVVVS